MYFFIGITLWKSQSKHGSHRQSETSYIASNLHKVLKKKDMKNKNLTSPELITLSASSNQVKTSETLLEAKSNSASNLANCKLNSNLSDLSIPSNNNNNQGDRTSKDFEHVSYKNRQSRRDVVKMLCKRLDFYFYCK